MKKYFVVIENIWHKSSKDESYSYSYVNGWDSLTEDFLISDLPDCLTDYACDDFKETLEIFIQNFNNQPFPFLFDTMEEAKNAVEIIRVHNHNKFCSSTYRIVFADTVTVSYPVTILDIV